MNGSVFVFDTGPFVITRDYYGGIFPGFWRKLDEAVRSGLVVSVEQVRAEIENYGGEQEDLLKWVKTHKGIFVPPDLEEQKIVTEIQVHLNKIGKSLVKGQEQLDVVPIADHFVIAKAIHYKREGFDYIVVTRETRKPKDKRNTGIPDVCDEFGVEAINLKEFLQRMGWKF